MNEFEIIKFFKLKLHDLDRGRMLEDIKYFFEPKQIRKNKEIYISFPNTLNDLFLFFSGKRDFQMMNTLLNLGADINYCNNILLLYISCLDIEAIQFLISKNIDLNYNDNEALKMCIFNISTYPHREHFNEFHGKVILEENGENLFYDKNFKIIELIIQNSKNKDSIDLNDFFNHIINISYCCLFINF